VRQDLLGQRSHHNGSSLGGSMVFIIKRYCAFSR